MANKKAQATSNDALTNILQKELDALGTGDNNRFVDSQWSFDIGRHRCSLDFSIFESPHLRFRKSIMGDLTTSSSNFLYRSSQKLFGWDK